MKRITLILLASMLTLGCFAQSVEHNLESADSDEGPVSYKDVHVQFFNLPTSFAQYYFVVTANFGSISSNYLQIDADWFFENPYATRNLYGELKWKNHNHEVFAIQKFYKRNVNYYDLPDCGSYKEVDIELGPLEYLHTLER